MSINIAVLGLGFVGLTTALGFAEKGHSVSGFDSNPLRLGEIARGKIPFHEPGLDHALSSNLGVRFHLADDLVGAVRQADIIFLCVGTPSGEDGAADLSILLEAVSRTLAAVSDDRFRLLVIKSTVPPGTTQGTVAAFMHSRNHPPGLRFGLATNPEFLREGYAWDDFINPDRIVVGVDDDRGWKLMESAYAGFPAPIHRVTPTEAEFVKYLSNTLLATLISFSNEMSMIAGCVGNIDIARAFRILHQDKRWSGSPAGMAAYAYPGCGFGGYCLPKDTLAMAHLAQQHGIEAGLLEQVIIANKKVKEAAVEKIAAAAAPGKTIGILGLSFKPDSDDVRESPARDIIEGLLRRGYTRIVAHDPMAVESFATAFQLPIQYARTLDEIQGEADVLVIATAWKEYRTIGNSIPVVDLRYCTTAPQVSNKERVS